MRAGRFPDEELAPSGYVTAAAGVTIYRGGAYPEKYRGAAFTGETAQNVVVCMGLSPNGVGFAAERLTGEKEFIASTDNWFRPVNFENGPDGCLYLVDMYREIIEDPSAIPEDIQEFLDMTSGRDASTGSYQRVSSGPRLRASVPPIPDSSSPNSRLRIPGPAIPPNGCWSNVKTVAQSNYCSNWRGMETPRRPACMLFIRWMGLALSNRRRSPSRWTIPMRLCASTV
jgi:hypothetical protein